ncbi:MAG: FHA domain-containing protein, partial [Thermoguttaceae bacterium]|nr:FHA domain-containing protein [Thermoguttaceae bacterium]
MPSYLKTAAPDTQKQTSYPIVKDVVVIGRNPHCDICLDDGAVSRIHARIRFDGARFTISDIASSNGTFLNGRRLANPAALYNGDRIRIGSGEFVFVTDFAKSQRSTRMPNYSVGSAVLDESLSKDSINFTSQVDLRNIAQQPLIRQPQVDMMAELKALRTKLDVMMSMMK